MSDEELTIQRYKIKRLIKKLEIAKGIGTSVITVYCPPKDQLPRVVTMLTNEMSTANNIKSHTNKLSVQSAITAALGRLKLIKHMPPNGMLLFSGTILNEENKEKKIVLDVEPFKPVSRSLYLCDNKFHTEELHRMLDSDDTYGFIVVDGNGGLLRNCVRHTEGETRRIFGRVAKETWPWGSVKEQVCANTARTAAPLFAQGGRTRTTTFPHR